MILPKGSTSYIFAIFLLTTMVLAGCQSIESYYRGYKPDNKNIISLSKPGPPKGEWKTFHVTVDYQYSYSGSVLNISGSAALNLYYKLNDSRIRNLTVYLFFLDNESKVIETAVLVKALDSNPNLVLDFSKELTAPPGTQSIAFGYSGESTGEEDRGNREPFYELPKRP